MTSYSADTAAGPAAEAGAGSAAGPAADAASGCPLHGTDFAADPQRTYDLLRSRGPAAPVEPAPGVRATLVVEHETARQVLLNPELFRRDAALWKQLREGEIPPDHPLVPMMGPRPNVMFVDGRVHTRLRRAVTESLAKLDTGRVRRDVEPIADYLIGRFSELGRADLIGDYAKLLPLLLFNKLFGCPGDIGDRLTNSMSALFDGRDAARANADLTACLMELIALKRREPGEDVTSWLLQHPEGLTDEELMHQLVLLMGAGVEPERNLIGNTLLLLLDDSQSRGMGIEEALIHVLWYDTPIANYATHYPVQDVKIGELDVEAGTPVIISFAAANADPALAAARQARNTGAHLAWGAGPHACPAQDPAIVIARTAIERLLNTLHDMRIDGAPADLERRPGLFHRALVSLPVTFRPTAGPRPAPSPAGAAATAAKGSPVPTAAPAPVPAPVPQETALSSEPYQPERKRRWWSTFLDVFRV